eukprot:2046531-Pyramimonas_sp.AAC.1
MAFAQTGLSRRRLLAASSAHLQRSREDCWLAPLGVRNFSHSVSSSIMGIERVWWQMRTLQHDEQLHMCLMHLWTETPGSEYQGLPT